MDTQLTTAMVPLMADSVASSKRISMFVKALVMSAKLGTIDSHG
jgi:hypothetical protein